MARRPGPPQFTRDDVERGWGQYVCWLDMMGAENALRGSIADAAARISRIHTAALQEADECSVIPVVDGVFLVGFYQYSVLGPLERTMARLAKDFVRTRAYRRHTLVRAGVASGPVAFGFTLNAVNPELRKREDYSEHLLVGLPLLHAYEMEKKAPPFGICVHESARTRAADGDPPLESVFHRWWDAEPASEVKALREKVERWYSWARKRPTELGYSTDRMEAHQAGFREFFRR